MVRVVRVIMAGWDLRAAASDAALARRRKPCAGASWIIILRNVAVLVRGVDARHTDDILMKRVAMWKARYPGIGRTSLRDAALLTDRDEVVVDSSVVCLITKYGHRISFRRATCVTAERL